MIFGPDDSFTNRFAALLRRQPELPLPGAEARFAPVFVGDVVQAFAAVLEDSATFGKTYELCGPDIFSLREVVSYVSQFMTLLPGDVISTGTPAGVGLGFKPPRFLRAGDVCELGIEGLGSSRQRAVPYEG